MFGSKATKQRTDKIKKNLCSTFGITLVEVPYWWNTKIESLMATIQHARPDVIQEPVSYEPIPLLNLNPSTHITHPLVDELEWNATLNINGWYAT